MIKGMFGMHLFRLENGNGKENPLLCVWIENMVSKSVSLR